MAGHLIVCGMGQVGYQVVELLCRLGEPVVVLALPTREDWVQSVRARGVEVLVGDARSAARLAEAGIATARALIAATDQDLVNVEIALDAKKLRPDLPVVVRIFDQTLARQIEASFDVRRALSMSALAAPTFAAAALGEQIIGSFVVDRELFVIAGVPLAAGSPLSEQTVRQVGAMHGLAVLAHTDAGAIPRIAPLPEARLDSGDTATVMCHTSHWTQVAGIPGPAAPESRAAAVWHNVAQAIHPGRALDFLRQVWASTAPGLRAVFITLNLLTLLSVAVFHYGMDLDWADALYFVVTTVTTVGYGDFSPKDAAVWLKLYACLLMILGSATIATLYSIITDFIVTARFRELLGQRRVPRADHIIIVGMGNVGFRIVNELRQAGIRTVAMQLTTPGEFVETVRAYTPVVVGDARLRDTLGRAGVERARAVLAVTDDDAVNISVALAAERLHSGVRTVVRLTDAALAQKVQTALSINVVLSPSTIAAPTFVAAALYADVRHAFVVHDALLVIRHCTVGAAWDGLSPARLRAEQDTVVLMRRSAHDGVYVPAHDATPLALDEHVLTVAWRALTN